MLQIVLMILGWQIVFLLLLGAFLRWVFKVNQVIQLLSSIDESLRQMPAAQAYRARKKVANRKVA